MNYCNYYRSVVILHIWQGISECAQCTARSKQQMWRCVQPLVLHPALWGEVSWSVPASQKNNARKRKAFAN